MTLSVLQSSTSLTFHSRNLDLDEASVVANSDLSDISAIEYDFERDFVTVHHAGKINVKQYNLQD